MANFRKDTPKLAFTGVSKVEDKIDSDRGRSQAPRRKIPNAVTDLCRVEAIQFEKLNLAHFQSIGTKPRETKLTFRKLSSDVPRGHYYEGHNLRFEFYLYYL